MKPSSFRASEWASYATYANMTTLVKAAYPLESSNQKKPVQLQLFQSYEEKVVLVFLAHLFSTYGVHAL